MIDHEALEKELKELHKGRAARRPDLMQRLGPQLRTLSGITDADTTAKARDKLRETIERLVGDQTPDLLQAALVEFALHPQAVHDTLADRRDWLAGELKFQPRTARRRMEAALAAILVSARESTDRLTPEPAGSDWRVRSLEAILDLTTNGPTLTERRIIEFVVDDLEEITCEVSVPQPTPPGGTPGQLIGNAVFGVRIIEVSQPADTHYAYRLQLPRRFRAGQRHEYSMTFQIPAGQPMANHYVMQPLTPCDEFRLIMRFDLRRLPEEIWTLDAVAPRVIDSDRPTGRRGVLDGLGELHLSFRGLRQGFAYGVKWLR